MSFLQELEKIMAGYRLSGEGYTDEEMRVLKRMCKSINKYVILVNFFIFCEQIACYRKKMSIFASEFNDKLTWE